MANSIKDIIDILSEMYDTQILDAKNGFNVLNSYKGKNPAITTISMN